MRKNKHRVTKTLNEINKFIFTCEKACQKMIQNMKKIWLIIFVITCSMVTSCNVTRVVTNQSEYYQRGDTSVVIQTRTTETYDATKKGF